MLIEPARVRTLGQKVQQIGADAESYARNSDPQLRRGQQVGEGFAAVTALARALEQLGRDVNGLNGTTQSTGESISVAAQNHDATESGNRNLIQGLGAALDFDNDGRVGGLLGKLLGEDSQPPADATPGGATTAPQSSPTPLPRPEGLGDDAATTPEDPPIPQPRPDGLGTDPAPGGADQMPGGGEGAAGGGAGGAAGDGGGGAQTPGGGAGGAAGDGGGGAQTPGGSAGGHADHTPGGAGGGAGASPGGGGGNSLPQNPPVPPPRPDDLGTQPPPQGDEGSDADQNGDDAGDGGGDSTGDLSPREQFIEDAGNSARAGYEQYGVPASVTTAQAILESGWGESGLTQEANNLFGVKCHDGDTGPIASGCVSFPTREVYDGVEQMVDADFRSYDSLEDSFLDHGRFLTDNPRYSEAFNYSDDPDQFLREVHDAGYATDPEYSNLVLSIMREHNLYRFDEPAQ